MDLFGNVAPSVFSVAMRFWCQSLGVATSNSGTLSELALESRAPRIKLMLLSIGLGVGGTEGQVLEIASRLDRRRFDVMVCALKGEDVIAQELRTRGIPVLTLNGKGQWDLRVIIRLWQAVSRERPMIIHAFLPWANLASRVVGRMLKVPILISSYRALEFSRFWPYRFVDRLTSRWASAITCSSDAILRLVGSEVGGEKQKYWTIHNGVDIDRFSGLKSYSRGELGLSETLPIIGAVSRMDEPTKGLGTLIHAMARINKQSSHGMCQLLLVGDGPAYKQLSELVAKLGLSECVVFLGMRRDIERILPLLDIFVMPSLSEGFGVAIVEAMAAGRPVVATAVGGIPEVVIHGETGLLVQPNDHQALAEAIEDLLRRPDYARALGIKGQHRAREKFSVERAVKRHEELYDAFLKNFQGAFKGTYGDTAGLEREVRI